MRRNYGKGDVVRFEADDMERTRGRVAQVLGDPQEEDPLLVIQPLDPARIAVRRLAHLVSLVQRWHPPRGICEHCGAPITRWKDEWGKPDTSEYAWGRAKLGMDGYDPECRPAADPEEDRPLPHAPVKVIEQPLPAE